MSQKWAVHFFDGQSVSRIIGHVADREAGEMAAEFVIVGADQAVVMIDDEDNRVVLKQGKDWPR